MSLISGHITNSDVATPEKLNDVGKAACYSCIFRPLYSSLHATARIEYFKGSMTWRPPINAMMWVPSACSSCLLRMLFLNLRAHSAKMCCMVFVPPSASLPHYPR